MNIDQIVQRGNDIREWRHLNQFNNEPPFPSEDDFISTIEADGEIVIRGIRYTFNDIDEYMSDDLVLSQEMGNVLRSAFGYNPSVDSLHFPRSVGYKLVDLVTKASSQYYREVVCKQGEAA